MKRKVLITGAGSGFGEYLAHSFGKAGYDLILSSRNERELKMLDESLSKIEGIKRSTVISDITTEQGLSILKDAIQSYKPDVLVNNAAMNPELRQGTRISEPSQIKEVLQTNTLSAIALSIMAFDVMVSIGGGNIINMNSVAGVKGSQKEPLYAASKAGLRGFSESVKDDWLKYGVKVTDVYAGAIATGMSSGRPDVKTLMNPEELADFVAKLCAPDSFFVREVYVQRSNGARS